jgi:hypothetical protein
MSQNWSDEQTRFLIDERKYRNIEYHQLPRGERSGFWQSIARRINREFGSYLSGQDCKEKFQNLVRAYYVNRNKFNIYLFIARIC